jgi:5-formyltetrahydrofolate cyclo-ligase
MADPGATRVAKTAMRRELLLRRRQITGERATQAARRACALICDAPEFEAASTLALFAALPDEIPTRPLFDAARAAGKRILLPAIDRADQLQFGVVSDWGALRQGRFGVLEPDPEAERVPLVSAEFVVVPGLGFTAEGHRLGYGKGYYDQALEGAVGTCFLVGLCFSSQLVSQLPCEAHDQRMQAVVSEQGMIRVAPDPGSD